VVAGGELRELIVESHRIVAAGLTRKARKELGLETPPAP
jgi:predicted DNA-binding protein (MmcQ/YjbR family)